MAARDPFDVAQQQFAGMNVKSKAPSASPTSTTSASATATTSPRPGGNGNGNGGIARLPLPLDLYPLAKTHMWLNETDPAEVVRRVAEALDVAVVKRGGAVEPRPNASKYACRAHGERACESCEFEVSVFDTRNESRAPGTLVYRLLSPLCTRATV